MKEKDGFEEIIGSEEARKEVERLVENLKVLNDVLESIKPLVESGALETLVGLGYLGETLKAILSDEMVSSFSSLGGSAMELLAKTKSPSVERLVSAIADHPMELEEEIKRTRVTGLLSLMRLLRDEDVRRGLAVAIAYLKLIGRYAYPEDGERDKEEGG